MNTKASPETSLTGVSFAILAAALFGASTLFSKILLGKTEPVLLAGLLYLGSGVGLVTKGWCIAITTTQTYIIDMLIRVRRGSFQNLKNERANCSN